MARSAKLTILLVCPWILPIAELRAALHEAGIDAEIVRVDFDARLRVAFEQHQFDAALYVATPGLSFVVVDSLVRQHAPKLDLTAHADLDQVADAIRRLVAAQRS